MTYEELKNANKTIRTMDIKGKQYAEVSQRIKVFRMICPNGTIQTELVKLENEICVIKAIIKDEQEKLLATGYAYETEGSSFINKTSYIENCETSAVGRALGMLGIGIDTSVASFEEVANAIHQEEGQKLITIPMVRALRKKMEREEVPENKILELYGLKRLEEMTIRQHNNLIEHFEKAKEQCKE